MKKKNVLTRVLAIAVAVCLIIAAFPISFDKVAIAAGDINDVQVDANDFEKQGPVTNGDANDADGDGTDVSGENNNPEGDKPVIVDVDANEGYEANDPNYKSDTPPQGDNNVQGNARPLSKRPEKKSIMINTAEELVKLSEDISKIENFTKGKHYKLGADISLKEYCGKNKGDWKPIGVWDKNSFDVHAFNGSFDGDGHTISGLYIENGGDGYGLFGEVEVNGSVRNLTVEGKVKGVNNVGGIVGHSAGRIANCRFSGTVEGKECVGGITGWLNNKEMTGCKVTGSVKGGKFIGGVVGDVWKGTVKECSYDNGTVSGREYVGGIVGLGNALLVDSCDTGYYAKVVSTGSYAGGIAGGSANPTNNCVNHATVKGEGGKIGGIAGMTFQCRGIYGTIDKCKNFGDVKGRYSTGGIVGEAWYAVTNCENKGKVTGNPAGDIIADNRYVPDTATIVASKKHMLIIPIGVAVIFVIAIVVFFLVWKRKTSVTDAPESEDDE